MDRITIRGAKVHNLKNIDVEIPRGKFVVVTGVCQTVYRCDGQTGCGVH